ncbi:MAG: DUF2169 domain-containing protein [Desulfobacteraceae bacterium]|nr:DUF2169 domain-containing protein [Desulfobacteraceae bacterium]
MWLLENNTPYATERTWVLDKNAGKHWIVTVKGTYNILPDGTTEMAAEQEEPLFLPRYFGEDGKSSIKYEADLIPSKQATDILINGKAYSPEGKPSRKVTLGLQTTNLVKQLTAYGDRRWEKGLLGMTISKPEPFTSMPIIYERAFGGTDTFSDKPEKHCMYFRNPIGTGFATLKKHLAGQALPNIEYTKERISSWKDRPRPAGFGAVASYWTPRKEYAGTYDEKWQKERFPLFPVDFDERFFQCAPEDQQVQGFLKGGEPVYLENFTPGGQLFFRLPEVFLKFETHFGQKKEKHEANLSTVIIEPEFPRVIMVWHTSLACHHLIDKLDATEITHSEYL